MSNYKQLILGFALASTFASTLDAQTTLLTETFDSGIVPPPGWGEINNGVSAGWEPDSTGLKAWHDDYFGANDNSLISPEFDASGVTEMYVHALQDQIYATYRDVNDVELSMDGGLTFITVYSENIGSSGEDGLLEIDLSAYAGSPSCMLSFHYIGDYANEWKLGDLLVDATPPLTNPHWPHLPSAHVSAGCFRENFDSLDGIIPSHMAVNMLDTTTRLDHPDAWCNVGQLATCLTPYDGASNLEMGCNPANTTYPTVSNALIIGLNGTGVPYLKMSFQAIHFGEELNDDDGVFVSTTGQHWQAVATDWTTLAGYNNYQLATCDLASTSVDVSGLFYVAIAQSDNYPYGDLDGVGIDNVTVGCPILTATNVQAGVIAELKISGGDSGGSVVLGYSLKAGPTTTVFGSIDIGLPYQVIGSYVPDASGNITAQLSIPSAAAGVTVWTQGVEFTATGTRITNGLKITVQ